MKPLWPHQRPVGVLMNARLVTAEVDRHAVRGLVIERLQHPLARHHDFSMGFTNGRHTTQFAETIGLGKSRQRPPGPPEEPLGNANEGRAPFGISVSRSRNRKRPLV